MTKSGLDQIICHRCSAGVGSLVIRLDTFSVECTVCGTVLTREEIGGRISQLRALDKLIDLIKDVKGSIK